MDYISFAVNIVAALTVIGSLSLLSELINQVLELHPHTKWLHIGADEVSSYL